MPHKVLNLKDNRLKVFFSIGFFVFAVVALVFFLVLPFASQVRDTRAKILQNQTAIEAQVTQIAEFQAAEGRLAKIKNSIADAQGLFPDREDSVNLVEALESALTRSQIAGAELNITDKKEGDQAGERIGGANPAPVSTRTLKHIEEVPFTLKYKNQYRNFTDFMQFVENLPFIIEINDFDVKAESEQTEDGGLNKTGFADGTIKGHFFIKQQ